jgi:hypothetical protein
MIVVNKIERVGFALVVIGNDGEEQLTICTSGGQNGQISVTIVANQVDLGPEHRVLLDGRFCWEEFQRRLYEVLLETHWPEDLQAILSSYFGFSRMAG